MSDWFFMAGDLRFANPPAMPQREGTINFPGGALSAPRGTLAALFNENAVVSACQSVVEERSRKQYQRTAYVGATPRNVDPSSWEQVKYPYTTKSIAKGGQPIQLRIQGENWTARLSGNLSNLADFFCAEGDKGNLNGSIAFFSERGSFFGPYSNTGTN